MRLSQQNIKHKYNLYVQGDIIIGLEKMHGVILEKIESTSFSAKNIDLSTEILRTIYIASTFFVPLYYPLLALFLPWRALLCCICHCCGGVSYI